ncbi:hypothetical protein yc1106_06736 [Curvularia clavata]|uniref:Azaphilone pigments biosynthesis cluster protein L N-terminal domain-containing protein n=1 Tax=Curvularia clavata TaxID=95742 RepID=A0A9Q9DU52_CURCL|nr:hypothetical protein yc1106_06736 [Curvularia clavata]
MADPLSIAASIASLLTLGIQSCRFLSNFFSKISDAPVEARLYQLCFQAMDATFCELQAICESWPATGEVTFPMGFEDRLTSCMKDLQSVDAFIRKAQPDIYTTTMKRAWAKVKYAMFADDRLGKFSVRLQQYQASFTLDLIAINTKLALLNSRQLTQIVSQTQKSIEQRSQFTMANVTSTSDLMSFSKPLGFLNLWSCNSDMISVVIYRRQGARAGFGGVRIKLKFQVGSWIRFVYFTFFPARAEMGSGISAHCTLMLPTILPFSAQVFRYACDGNTNTIRSMFLSRKATPTDTTPDGASLLNIATQNGHLELVEFLLQCGADVEASDDHGRTTPSNAKLRTDRDM